MKQKNILLITSDQQRLDTLGKLNPCIKTPNLDKLADDGILFTRGYTCNPVCTPSRISMLTGEYPSRHGCYTIGTSLPEDYPTVPQLLRDNGYFTSLIGKAHFQSCLYPDSFEAAPHIHDTEFFKHWNGDFYGFEYAKLIIGHGDEPHSAGMHYEVWLREKGIDPSKYFGNTPYYSYGKWNLPDEVSSGQWTFEESAKAIDMAQEQDRPFFLWSSFQNPHNPCYTPEPWASMYDDVELPVYGYKEGEMDDRPEFYQNIRNWDKIAAGEDHPKYGPDVYEGEKNWHCCSGLASVMDKPEEKQKIMKQYYAMVSQMDHYIGKIIDYLKEKNLYDDTLIIFTSDHGDYMGNHGLWWKGLPAYEDIQNVPLIVHHPDCKQRGVVSESLQSLIDIPATVLKIAGVKSPYNIQGQDAESAWVDPNIKTRDSCLIEFRPTESPYMQTTLVTDEFKLVVYANRDYGELYHLHEDKNQYHNLWDNPAYQDTKMKLLLKLAGAEMDKNTPNLRTRFAPA